MYSLELTGPYQNGFKSLRQLATPGPVIEGLSQSRPALRSPPIHCKDHKNDSITTEVYEYRKDVQFITYNINQTIK